MKTKQSVKNTAPDWMTHFGALNGVLSSMDAKARASAAQFIIRHFSLVLANDDTNEARNAFLCATTLACHELQIRIFQDTKYHDLIRSRASVPALFPSARKEREQLAESLRKVGLGSAALFKETLKKRRQRPEVERAEAFALLADLAQKHSADHVATGTGLPLPALAPLQKLPAVSASTLRQWQNAFWEFSCALADGVQNLTRSKEWENMTKARMDAKTHTITVPQSVLRQAFDRALAQVLKVSGK